MLGMLMIFGKIIGIVNVVFISDFLKGGGGLVLYFYLLFVVLIVGIGGGINYFYGG